jgi:hypothetical protein
LAIASQSNPLDLVEGDLIASPPRRNRASVKLSRNDGSTPVAGYGRARLGMISCGENASRAEKKF